MRSVGKTSEAEEAIEAAQSEARSLWFKTVEGARRAGRLAEHEINHCLAPDNIKRWWPLADTDPWGRPE